MNEINVKISFKDRTCEKTGVSLTSGDYKSTKMVFSFDDAEGQKILEIKNPSNVTCFVGEIINNEVILVGDDGEGNDASIFTEEGTYIFEVSQYKKGGKLTSASGKLKVKPEQVTVDDETVESYLPVFDELLSDIEAEITKTSNLNITMSKSSGIATITLTNKNGETQTVQISDGEKGATGDKGSKGDPGNDGYSPSANIQQTSTGAVVTVVDKNGTTTATLLNGAKGDQGTAGANGADGYSPSASVSKSGGTTTISITDKNGTTTAQVLDGDDYTLTNQDKADIADIVAEGMPTLVPITITTNIEPETEHINNADKATIKALAEAWYDTIDKTESFIMDSKLAEINYIYFNDKKKYFGNLTYTYVNDATPTIEVTLDYESGFVDTYGICVDYEVVSDVFTYVDDSCYGISYVSADEFYNIVGDINTALESLVTVEEGE